MQGRKFGFKPIFVTQTKWASKLSSLKEQGKLNNIIVQKEHSNGKLQHIWISQTFKVSAG